MTTTNNGTNDNNNRQQGQNSNDDKKNKQQWQHEYVNDSNKQCNVFVKTATSNNVSYCSTMVTDNTKQEYATLTMTINLTMTTTINNDK